MREEGRDKPYPYVLNTIRPDMIRVGAGLVPALLSCSPPFFPPPPSVPASAAALFIPHRPSDGGLASFPAPHPLSGAAPSVNRRVPPRPMSAAVSHGFCQD